MTDSFDLLNEELRRRARRLHKRAKAHDADALRRVRRAPALAGHSDAEVAARVQRKHCFEAIARALGFTNWSHAAHCLRGDPEEDVGTFMHRSFGGAHWNVWVADHAEAQAIRRTHGGYLLGYRSQFLVVERPYIEELGLDPENEDWAHIAWDLSRSHGQGAWARLAHQAVQARLFDS